MPPRVLPEDRIRDIVRAAASRFNHNGFQHAKTADIAREAGVAEGTIYNYFTSKAHLFLYVMEHGVPVDGEPLPSPETSAARTEQELLRILKKKLMRESRLRSVEKCLSRKPQDVDLADELREIFEEWWNIMENHRIQIAILEKSSHEFPAMEKVYGRYGRNSLLRQIEKYLAARTQMGLIRGLNSVPGMAHAMMEALSRFAWKQSSLHLKPHIPKHEILPDLIVTFVHGLDTARFQVPAQRDRRAGSPKK
jgi:AcrR family transcriptional regulator